MSKRRRPKNSRSHAPGPPEPGDDAVAKTSSPRANSRRTAKKRSPAEPADNRIPTSRRYSPPSSKGDFKFRSPKEKLVGATLTVAGLLVVALNYASEIDAGLILLPGGHLEFYFVGGVVVAGFGVWHTGVLDRQ